MKLTGMNVDGKQKTQGMSVQVIPHFSSMEQKLLFHAVVMPEIAEVLNKYADMLGAYGYYDYSIGGEKND